MFYFQMTEAIFFVKVYSCGTLTVTLQKQTPSTRPTSLIQTSLHEPASDAMTLYVGIDGELHQFVVVLRILAAHHGKRADSNATEFSHEYHTALLDDILQRMVDLVDVGLFDDEQLANPSLIENLESLVMFRIVVVYYFHFFHVNSDLSVFRIEHKVTAFPRTFVTSVRKYSDI